MPKSNHRNSVLLCIPIFILEYLFSSSVAVARPVSDYQSRRQNPQTPLLSSPIQGGAAGTTWTYNYWWPYPPAGAATTIPATTNAVPSPIATTTDRITLVLPEPTSGLQEDQNSNEPQPLSDPASFTTRNNASSITLLATTATPVSSTLALTGDQGLGNMERLQSQPHKFNIIYFIPIFAVVGFLLLAGMVWLIYGCCTRKPKYRPPLLPPSRKNSGETQAGISEGCDYDKEAFDVSLPRISNEATFKAFRYEDFAAGPEHQYTLEDTVWDTPSRESQSPCRHTRDYGFKCDCRLSLIESEQYQYHWPRTQLQDIPDDEEDECVIGGSECSTVAKSPSNACPCGTFSPLEVLSDSCSEPDPLSQNGVDSESEVLDEKRDGDGHFDNMGTIGRREKLLELVRMQEQKRRRALRRGTTKKTRALTKSTKSTKSTKTCHTTLTDLSVYSEDSATPDEAEGFQMLVESPSPPSTTRVVKPLRVSTRRKKRDVRAGDCGGVTGEGWVGKVADALGSSLSRLSGGGKDEDKYTALPEPSNRENRLDDRNRNHTKNAAPGRKRSKLSRHTSPAQDVSKPSHQRRGTIDDSTANVGEGEIARQRRRLQHHRESIASLPAGMIYSPAMLGVCVFGEETAVDRVDPITSFSFSREKHLPQPPT